MHAYGVAVSSLQSDLPKSRPGSVSEIPAAYRPYGTVRCQGKPGFRSQLTRDLGCLLDVDDDVIAWSCLPVRLGEGEGGHTPDFLIRKRGGHILADAGERAHPPWVVDAARERGCEFETVSESVIRQGHRLANAKDLLRYAGWRCPLGDRIRLLTGLEEQGSLTVAEALSAFLETRPIAGLASLALNRFVSIDLDTAPIGPGTTVRAWNP